MAGRCLALLAYPGLIPGSPGWSVLLEARSYAIYVALGAFLAASFIRDDVNRTTLALTSIAGLGLPALAIGSGHDQGLTIALALSGAAGVISHPAESIGKGKHQRRAGPLR